MTNRRTDAGGHIFEADEGSFQIGPGKIAARATGRDGTELARLAFPRYVSTEGDSRLGLGLFQGDAAAGTLWLEAIGAENDAGRRSRVAVTVEDGETSLALDTRGPGATGEEARAFIAQAPHRTTVEVRALSAVVSIVAANEENPRIVLSGPDPAAPANGATRRTELGTSRVTGASFLILTSPNGTPYLLTVSDAGALVVEPA